MDWQVDQEGSRPQPPPSLDLPTARRLFNNPRLVFRRGRTGLQELSLRRRVCMQSLPVLLLRLRRAEEAYSDGSPKTNVGVAVEWNECRRAAEALLNQGRAYLSLLLEEETE